MRAAERVARAIACEKPDRIPFIGLNGFALLRSDVLPLNPLTPNSWQPPGSEYYPHVSNLQLRFRPYKWKAEQWNPKPPKDWKKWKFSPHKEIDEWGVIWEVSGKRTMGCPVEGSLKSWDQLNDLVIPDGSNAERYALFRKIVKLVPRKSKYRLGTMDTFIFGRTHFLRGWNNYMIDLIRAPQKIQMLIDRILPFYEGEIHQLHELGAQAVFAFDDWASQEDVLISPLMFDRIFRDPYKKIINLCHDLGMVFLLHSCGNIGKFLPKFIEIGIDGVQIDSPHMAGLNVMQKYAGKICFICCVDIQKVYPNGTTEDVVKEVLTMMNALGNQGGGFIAIDYEEAETVLKVPKANIQTFERTVRKYGHYRPDGTLDKHNWPEWEEKEQQ